MRHLLTFIIFLTQKKYSFCFSLLLLTFSIADLEFSNASKQAARFAIGHHSFDIDSSWWLPPAFDVIALPRMQSTTANGGFFKRKYRENTKINSTATTANHDQLIFNINKTAANTVYKIGEIILNQWFFSFLFYYFVIDLIKGWFRCVFACAIYVVCTLQSMPRLIKDDGKPGIDSLIISFLFVIQSNVMWFLLFFRFLLLHIYWQYYCFCFVRLFLFLCNYYFWWRFRDF